MPTAISPARFLRHGTANVSVNSLIFLAENPRELQSLVADLDGRRDAALEAIAAADVKLAAAEAREAELEQRERKLADVLSGLEPREEAVALGTKAICDAVDWFEANPLPSTEGI